MIAARELFKRPKMSEQKTNPIINMRERRFPTMVLTEKFIRRRISTNDVITPEKYEIKSIRTITIQSALNLSANMTKLKHCIRHRQWNKSNRARGWSKP